jgi:catechol-2,3-dioxygenase
MSIRFRHLGLMSHSLREQRRFYERVLGLQLTGAGADHLTIEAGSTRIQFTKSEPGTRPVYHFAFNIPENKLDAAIKWMEPRSPLLRHYETGEYVVDFPEWNAHSIYFNDPAGNILEFIARHDLKNGAPGGYPGAFGADDILYVSEIGLVVREVPAAVDTLKRLLDVKEYSGASEQFTAVGDEHGLLIVVKEGRGWLPTTEVKAAIFPTDVTLESAGPDSNARNVKLHVGRPGISVSDSGLSLA